MDGGRCKVETEEIFEDPFASCGAEFPHIECVDLVGGGLKNAPEPNMFAPTNIHLEETTVEDVQQALLSRMDRMEQNMTFMLKRVFTEVITLRKENAILKAKVQEALDRYPTMPPANIQSQWTQSPVSEMEELFKCEVDATSITEPHLETSRKKIKTPPPSRKRPPRTRKIAVESTNSVIPESPFTVEDDFLKFEQNISEDMDKEQRLVDELAAIECINQDKYIRICWRKLLADQAAEKFCWRGTATKKSIRDLSVTIALKTACQKKYVDHGVFDRVTCKWFRYAHDRILHHNAYHRTRCIHTGEELHTCPHCPREFNTKANVYVHLKRDHYEKWLQLKTTLQQTPLDTAEQQPTIT